MTHSPFPIGLGTARNGVVKSNTNQLIVSKKKLPLTSRLPQNVLDIKDSLTQEWQTNYDSLHLLIGHRFDVLNSFPMERKINLRSDIDPNYEAYPEITEKNIRWLKVFLESLKSFTCAKKKNYLPSKAAVSVSQNRFSNE